MMSHGFVAPYNETRLEGVPARTRSEHPQAWENICQRAVRLRLMSVQWAHAALRDFRWYFILSIYPIYNEKITTLSEELTLK
jgi:hypothetical protein